MKHLGRMAYEMVKQGETAVLLEQLKIRAHSDRTSLILRCDLSNLPPPPTCKIPLTIRKLEPGDIPAIVKERPRRLPILLGDVPTCYLGVTESGQVAYTQWAVLQGEWERFRKFFAGMLHKELNSDEVLLEFAYTFEAFRGMGVMGAAMREILGEMCREHPELRYSYTYVLSDNIPSLKGCKNAGYRPHMERKEFYRGGRLIQEFWPLPPNAKYSFEVQ